MIKLLWIKLLVAICYLVILSDAESFIMKRLRNGRSRKNEEASEFSTKDEEEQCAPDVDLIACLIFNGIRDVFVDQEPISLDNPSLNFDNDVIRGRIELTNPTLTGFANAKLTEYKKEDYQNPQIIAISMSQFQLNADRYTTSGITLFNSYEIERSEGTFSASINDLNVDELIFNLDFELDPVVTLIIHLSEISIKTQMPKIEINMGGLSTASCIEDVLNHEISASLTRLATELEKSINEELNNLFQGIIVDIPVPEGIGYRKLFDYLESERFGNISKFIPD